MATRPPLLSIGIPTRGRPELLDHCLEQVRGFERFGLPLEVIVSESVTTDATARLVKKRQKQMAYLKHCPQLKKLGPYSGVDNALRNATGKYVVVLADDDSLIFENIVIHIQRMEREPDLAAIFADWIAFDDEQGRELHRYFGFREPAVFGPGDPVGLVNFVIGNQVYPEVGVYRREALLKSDCIAKHSGYPALRWMYRLSRVGRIAFELLPTYREHRVLKKQFQREVWENMDSRLKVIGDEMRLELETLLHWALQDSGLAQVPEDQLLNARKLIDGFLHRRTSLEVARAMADRNWLLAADLQRRLSLWYGPGPIEEQQRILVQVSLPAALQAVNEYYQLLTGVRGLVLAGFAGTQVAEFFSANFPEIKLVDLRELAKGADGEGMALVLYRNETQDGTAGTERVPAGYRLYLDRLLWQHGVTPLAPEALQL